MSTKYSGTVPSKIYGQVMKNIKGLTQISFDDLEGSGSVVECLTQDRGAAGSSLTGVT